MAGLLDKLKQNRGESLQPRPAPVAGTSIGGGGVDAGFRDRKAFRNACLIAIDRIQPDKMQPRQTFAPESLDRLVESIRARGQLVPILVRWSAEAGCFVLIDGERRYRAACRAGLAEMSCVVESEADPSTLLEIQLVTNALREDVSPMEQAQAWRRLIEAKGYSHAELATKLGYDRSTITRTVGLNDLPPALQEAVHTGAIKPQTGYELSRVADPVEQSRLADEARAGRLRRDDLKGQGKASPSKARPAKGKSKGKPATKRRFKGPAGLVVTVERARGLDPVTLVETLRQFAELIETESSLV